MFLVMYSIYDSCAKLFDRPFYSHGDPHAQRSFRDVVLDAEHPIGKHPEDYMLMRVGTFDSNSGAIVPCEPVKVITGLDCVKESQKPNGEDLAVFDRKVSGHVDVDKEVFPNAV